MTSDKCDTLASSDLKTDILRANPNKTINSLKLASTHSHDQNYRCCMTSENVTHLPRTLVSSDLQTVSLRANHRALAQASKL